MSVTVEELHRRLERRYPKEKGWVLFRELRECPGFGSARTIDAYAVNTWDSKRLYAAIECKVSVEDFRRETPSKRATFLENSTEFWYCAPRGVIPVEEVPEGCGLLETWGADGLRATRRAVQRDSAAPNIDMFLMMLRASSERVDAWERRMEREGVTKVLGRSMTYEELRAFGLKVANYEVTRQLDDLSYEVHRTEKQTAERREWWHRWRGVVDTMRTELGLGWTERNKPDIVRERLLHWIAARKGAEEASAVATRLRAAARAIEQAIEH